MKAKGGWNGVLLKWVGFGVGVVDGGEVEKELEL